MTDIIDCPAPAFSFANPVSALRSTLRCWRRRRQFRRLLDLDDRMLDDLGVTRAEVVDASYWPLSVNAAVEMAMGSRTPFLVTIVTSLSSPRPPE